MKLDGVPLQPITRVDWVVAHEIGHRFESNHLFFERNGSFLGEVDADRNPVSACATCGIGVTIAPSREVVNRELESLF